MPSYLFDGSYLAIWSAFNFSRLIVIINIELGYFIGRQRYEKTLDYSLTRPYKGIYGLQRYVGLAVIAYNLRRVGKILLDTDFHV